MSVHWVFRDSWRGCPGCPYMGWGNCTKHFPWVFSQLSAFCHSVTSWARDDCRIFSRFLSWGVLLNLRRPCIHSSLTKSLVAHPHLLMLNEYLLSMNFISCQIVLPAIDFFKAESWADQVYVIAHILGFFDQTMKNMISLLRISIPYLCS